MRKIVADLNIEDVDSLNQEQLLKEIINSYTNWAGPVSKLAGDTDDLGGGLKVRRNALSSRLEEKFDENYHESEFLTFVLNGKIAAKAYWDFDEDNLFDTPHIITINEEALKEWLKNKLSGETSVSALTVKSSQRKADEKFIDNNREYYDALLKAKDTLKIIINQDDKISDNGVNDYQCLNDALALIEEFIEAAQS